MIFLRCSLVLWIVAIAALDAWAANGEFTIRVIDKDTGKPVACRMHLKNPAGKVQKIPNLPFWKDHFVFDGEITFKLPKGTYNFEIERGPEYRDWKGYFTLENGSKDKRTIELHRACNMAEEGWWSGDLHIHRSPKEIELLMRAEDLHVAPVITWWNDKNEYQAPTDGPVRQFDGDRYYDSSAGEDEREGGALLYFRLPEPLAITGASREYPSPMKFLLQAREQSAAWIDVEKPFWWDVPVWLASEKVDSIGLANNHMCRGEMLANEAWGKPRDKALLPNPWGNGRWSQEIYYHVLNCGLRIPPSAGSASGVLPNPVGYNRVYVHVDPEEFNYETWWENFRKGQVVVTNGPLIRPQADGELPGYVFQSDGEPLELDVWMNMTNRETISYVELIKNGKVAHSMRYEDLAASGHFPPLKFEESGWFLVRAITDVEQTFRFASSAPWYVEVGEAPRRISKSSAQFFCDWVEERMQRVKLDDAEQKREVLQFHEQARAYWRDLLSRANAE